MGRNGSGKTTLAYALMGHPGYHVTAGEVIWKGRTSSACRPTSAPGWASSSPSSTRPPIPGLSVASFLRTALNARRRGLDVGDASSTRPTPPGAASGWRDFRKLMREKMALLKLDDSFAARYVNEGFSGGEKKRLEMLQMAVLEPEFADPRRDRLGPRHRRPAHRRRGRQRPAQPRPGGAAHHPLPAPAQLHQARPGPRPGPRPHHRLGRQGPGPAARGGGLRAHPAGGRLRGSPRRGRRRRAAERRTTR